LAMLHRGDARSKRETARHAQVAAKIRFQL
jgi:hypothetical protein